MVETPQDELSLRDIVEVLKRHRVYLWAFPLILAALALIYGFLIAEPTYASTVTISVGPLDQQGQAPTLTFEGVRSIAFSQTVLGQVWEALAKEGKLPPRWRVEGAALGISRLRKDFSLKDAGSSQANASYLLVRLSIEAPDPEVAAQAANLWAEATKREVDSFFRSYWARIEKRVQAEFASAEARYREALARRRAFLNQTTLFRDRAELDFLQGIPFLNFSNQSVQNQSNQSVQNQPVANQQVILLNTDRPYGERLRLLREIAEAEGLLATAQEGKRRALEKRREQLKLQLQKIEDRIKALQGRVARAEEELAAQDESLSRAREVYLALAQRLREIRVVRLQGEWASVLAPAYPIYEKVAPKRGLLLALAVALGLMLGVMAAFVAEALRPKEASVSA